MMRMMRSKILKWGIKRAFSDEASVGEAQP
jgi:hypothetical protein